MIELNEKITSETVTNIFAILGLTEAIIHLHIDTGLVPTRQRESHHIYGIYNFITLQVLSGDYLPFGIIPSDHRLL